MTKPTQNQMLYGIILTAIAFAAGGVITYDNANADITNDSKAEMFNFMADTYVSNERFNKLFEDFVLHVELEQAVDNAISSNFTAVAKAHKNLMAMV